MSNTITYNHMDEPMLKERATVACITLNVFAGCSSSDEGDSVHSDGTDAYLPGLGCFTVNRRKRKMLQPKRAPMYASEVSDVWCNSTAESECYTPRPVKRRVEATHTPIITSRPVSVAQKPVPKSAASKTKKKSSSKAAKCSRKSCSPVCGPCSNCGITTSPQWRHGNDEKPIVCNACGIRYIRTGSFARALPEKKRAASSGSSAMSGGAHSSKRCKIDSQSTSSVDMCPADNIPEAVSRPVSRATTECRSRRRPSPTETILSNAASPCASPALTPLTADTISAPASPRRQQHVPTHRGRRSHSGSRLGPSPLGRVSMAAPPPAGDAPAPGQLTTHPATAAFVPVGQVISSTAPYSAGTAIPEAPVASIPSTAAPAGSINGSAAGTAAAHMVIQPELVQFVSMLATWMGSFDAAIAYLEASASGMAAGSLVVPVAGVPGQVPARIQ